MGDPRKQRKKFDTPRFRWRKDVLQEELKLLGQYGLRNKHELWRHKTTLSKARGIARSLISQTTEQRTKMENELLAQLKKEGHPTGNSSPRQRPRLNHRRHTRTQTTNHSLPQRTCTHRLPSTPTHHSRSRKHRQPPSNHPWLHRSKRGRSKNCILRRKCSRKTRTCSTSRLNSCCKAT